MQAQESFSLIGRLACFGWRVVIATDMGKCRRTAESRNSKNKN